MTCGILLCAGQGLRFKKTRNEAKLLAKLPDGRTVVAASAANLLQAVGRVFAVVAGDARNDTLIRALDDCGCQVVLNPQAATGMGGSIAVGVVASEFADGWLLALGDMPYVQPATIKSIVALGKQTQKIIVPTHNNQRGHPVFFPSSFHAQLLDLQGDTGARSVVLENADRVLEIAVDDSGVLLDVDVPNDLK
jgi:molybdenum cofactor cytidylyltransferase